jgi:hypothetical protein
LPSCFRRKHDFSDEAAKRSLGRFLKSGCGDYIGKVVNIHAVRLPCLGGDFFRGDDFETATFSWGASVSLLRIGLILPEAVACRMPRNILST